MAKNTNARIRLSGRDRLSLFTGLSTMLMAGISILDAVESLLTDSKGNPRKVLTQLRSSLYNGQPLSKMLEQMPRAFDPVSVNLIRSAEAGGTLETTLHDIVVSTKKEMAFSDQLRITMIYPLFVMVIFFGIIVLMLTFVIPRVASVFTNMDVKIPLVTRIMMKCSIFFLANWVSVAIVFVILIALVVVIIRSNKRLAVSIVLSLPMLRTLGTNIDLARFCRSFGLLMHAGVPIVEALDLSERVVHKKRIVSVVQQMKIDVSAGKPLAMSMRVPKSIIPPIMSRSIKTAESSGALDQTLQNLTEYFDEQVSESLKILSSLVEPILIIMVGVMVGALMISIIAPIYSMISQIGVIPK